MAAANFTVTTVDVATDSPRLVTLSARSYDSDYTQLPNANLPKGLRAQLTEVFEHLTGEDLPLEENTFLIKANEGSYSRLFGPVLNVGSEEVEGTEPGRLYIRWGPRYIPLGLEQGSFTGPLNQTLDVEFAEYNFSGRGEDPALMISIEQPNGVLQMPIAVRFADLDNPLEAKALNALLKKNPEQLLEILQVVKSSSSRENLPEVDIRRDLEEGVIYDVVGYRRCNTRFGVKHRVVFNNFPAEGEKSEAWASRNMNTILLSDPEVSEERPASYVIKDRRTNDAGKIVLTDQFILHFDPEAELGEEELDLDF